jgi:glycosyltransferase
VTVSLPRISVVTAVRNGAGTILDCLASVRAQTHHAEHIVVDGDSSDGTVEVVREWARDSLVVKSGRDRGIYDAMNKGIELSSGEIFGTLNADDFYARDSVLGLVASAFQNPTVDACFGDLLYVRERPRTGMGEAKAATLVAHRPATGSDRLFALRNEKVVRYWRSGPMTPRAFARGWMPPHPTFFVRRRVFDEFGKYRLDMGSAADYELMLRFLVRHRLRSAYLPHVLVKMRCGGTSNRSLRARLHANLMDRKAWTVNGLTPAIATLYLKPLRKVPQWLHRPPEDDRDSTAHDESVLRGIDIDS